MPNHIKQNMVTGAFSYSGKYIARRLLSMGQKVRTLTGHPHKKDLLDDQIQAFPLDFNKPERIIESLQGVDTLYNSYWIRFPYRNLGFDDAVGNSLILFELAKKAGVKRIVHISITNADENSPLPYFSGKGMVERMIKESGISFAILRPTVVFGKEDILINNIAWFLRKFPVFGIFGDGQYKIQPIYVEDLAGLAVHEGMQSQNRIIDAAGPETFAFMELVSLIKEKIQSRSKILRMNPTMALAFVKAVGILVKDIILTKDEIQGLTGNLLYSKEQPRGKTRLSSWLEENRSNVGIRYSSELRRHY